jgi:hypothetical protein
MLLLIYTKYHGQSLTISPVTSAATFTRLSLHCFYYRLVQDTGKTWFRWCIHLNVIYSVGILVSFM